MATHPGRLRLTQYDGGDSPKWINDPDGEASYNEDMAKIEEWAALIDPVTIVRPAPAICSAEAAAMGENKAFAKADHRHHIATGVTSTDVQLGGTSSPGSAETVSFSKSDHTHKIEVGSTSTDVQLNGDSVPGIANSFSRSDHTHKINVGEATDLVVGGDNVEGSLTSLSRSDHKHKLPPFSFEEGTFCEGNDPRLVRVDHALSTHYLPRFIYSGHLPWHATTGAYEWLDTKSTWTWMTNPNVNIGNTARENVNIGNTAREQVIVKNGDIIKVHAYARVLPPVGVSYSIGVGLFYANTTSPFRLFTTAYGENSNGESYSINVDGVHIMEGITGNPEEVNIEIRMGVIASTTIGDKTKVLNVGSTKGPNDENVEFYTGLDAVIYSPPLPFIE